MMERKAGYKERKEGRRAKTKGGTMLEGNAGGKIGN